MYSQKESLNQIVMQLSFLEHFYHDVEIKSVTYQFSKEDGSNSIEFQLSEINDDENVMECTCSFVDVYESFSLLAHNTYGSMFIMEAKVDNYDEWFIDYLKKKEIHYSKEILESLKCYVINTTNGTLKIISSRDIKLL